MSTRQCIFCGKSTKGGKGSEHVLPHWLLKRLDLKKKPIHLARRDMDGEVTPVRTPSLDKFRVGHKVCDECNHGWMASLEAEAEPILFPLIEGTRISLRHLSESDLCLLGRWIAKTGYTLAAAIDSDCTVPLQHSLALQSGSLHNRVYTFASFSQVPHPYHMMACSSWPIFIHDPKPSEAVRRAIGQSYKIVFQVEWFVFAVVYWSLADWELGIFTGIHEPVWPVSGQWRVLGHSNLPAVHSLTYFAEMIESMAVLEPGVDPFEKVAGPVKYFKGIVEPR